MEGGREGKKEGSREEERGWRERRREGRRVGGREKEKGNGLIKSRVLTHQTEKVSAFSTLMGIQDLGLYTLCDTDSLTEPGAHLFSKSSQQTSRVFLCLPGIAGCILACPATYMRAGGTQTLVLMLAQGRY